MKKFSPVKNLIGTLGGNMKNLLLVLMMFSTVYAYQNCADVGGDQWCYDISTFQAFYMFEEITIDGAVTDEGGDILGAFIDDVCVGWISLEATYTTLPAMGNDGSFPDYVEFNEVIEVRYYDASNDVVLEFNASQTLPGWANNEIFIIAGTSSVENIFGCIDSDACNYMASATADDESCEYASENFDCNGNCIVDIDCAGVCGGILELDDCGDCDGGNAAQDECGICDGDNSTCEDECGVPNGDNATCSGCMSECAENYDENALVDNGLCEHVVPSVELTATDGPNRVLLNWTAPELMCGLPYTYTIYDSEGNELNQTPGTAYQVVGLVANEEEYCFSVSAKNEAYGESEKDTDCAIPFQSIGMTWGLQLSASINGWGTFDAHDTENFLGVAADASYGFDYQWEIPEPPVGVGNYISLYFPHEEWGDATGEAGNNFTQDIVMDNSDWFNENLTRWDAEVISNMSGIASVTFDYINTPQGVPMYVELLDVDGDSFHPITNGSSVEFFLSQGNPQRIAVHIGNIVPTVTEAALSAVGGDRRIDLEWAASAGRYPATSYTLEREGADNVVQSGTSYADTEDRENNEGQGLLYESNWAYTVTASNAAGVSTDGYSVITSGGYQENFAGTSSSASATTEDNLPPSSVVAYGSVDCIGSNGEYTINHDGSPAENPCNINLTGSGSSDPDGTIDRYLWTQIEGETLTTVSGTTTSGLSFDVKNPHDGDMKHFSFNLHVESDYPKKGGTVYKASDATISLSVAPEPNTEPTSVITIRFGDSESVATMNDYDDGNDYDADKNWYVPHDNNPTTNTASLSFDAISSSDPEGDGLSFQWQLLSNVVDWSYNDLDADGEYDMGEPLFEYGGINLDDTEVVSYNDDLLLELVSELYIVEMTVTDTYGDTETSAVVVNVLGERNEPPTAFAGADQAWYMEYKQDVKNITVDDNTIADTDGDAMTYSWSSETDTGFSNSMFSLVQDLAEGEHTFTLTTTDGYGESASDDVTITIKDEPDAPAASISISHTDLKYTIIDWVEGTLTAADYIIDGTQTYTGSMNNTHKFELYRNGELISTIDDTNSNNDSYQHVDESLSASTAYSYEVKSYNSDNNAGASSGSVGTTTHDLPTVTVLNPNGNEILTVGDQFTVSFTTTNPQYIDQIDLYYDNGGDTSGDPVATSTIGTDDSFMISDANGQEVSTAAAVRIVITDVGDYNGDHTDTNEDSSDHPFTMAARTLTKDFPSGWSMFGSALDTYSSPMDDLLSPSFGGAGSYWVYDANRAFTDLTLTLGEGFYLLLNDAKTLELTGDPITGDPDNTAHFSEAIIDLEEGWNLIANPLVVGQDKSELTVTVINSSGEGESLSWYDAVDAGWVAPTINGWFDDSHYSYNNLQPWGGYWINTSRDLSVGFRPANPALARKAVPEDNSWMLTIKASDVNGNAAGDYIIVGLSEDANSKFTYGEDEFDLPRPAVSSLVDLHIDNQSWIGTKDANNIHVAAPYFYKDIRSTEYTDYQAWNFSAESYNVKDIELSWNAPEDMEADVHLVINGEVIDMKSETSIEITTVENAAIVVGNVDSFMKPVPEQFALSAAYPNPFNPTTNLSLDLNDNGQVSVKVYNVVGQVVSELVNGHMDAGYHTITWEAGSISSGMYLVRVESGVNIATQKVMLLK